MKRLPGSLLFLSAAVYLATAQVNIDAIAFLAVIACAVCGVISLTHKSFWAIVGGTGLIGISLGLQTALNYRCSTCLRADILILAAVICLSIFQKGKVKIPSRVMASVMSIIMLTVTLLVTPIGAGSASSEPAKVPVGKIDAQIEELAKTKPVLLFNPRCSACSVVTSDLIKLDPEGKRWQPVQSGGDAEEGMKYLREKGFKGGVIFHKYNGGIPALVVLKEGKTQIIHGHDNIIKEIN